MTNDEAVFGPKNFFFAIFGTFRRYITKLRGTFVENVKKVENQPTLVYNHKSIVVLVDTVNFDQIRIRP
jgi:hypothetical protein